MSLLCRVCRIVAEKWASDDIDEEKRKEVLDHLPPGVRVEDMLEHAIRLNEGSLPSLPDLREGQLRGF